MKKSDYLAFIVFSLLIVFGIWMGEFWGGCIAGVFSTLLIVVTVGKAIYIETKKRQDRVQEAINDAMRKSDQLRN